MFGLSFPEMLVVAVVALIVLGPERLPGAARAFGKAFHQFNAALNEARLEIERPERVAPKAGDPLERFGAPRDVRRDQRPRDLDPPDPARPDPPGAPERPEDPYPPVSPAEGTRDDA